MSSEFKIAYVILAHHKPQQLARLVNRLNGAESGFFIHIDKRKDISPFREALRDVPASISFVKRTASAWGTIGAVKNVLNAMAAVLDSRVRYDYVVFITGQDYPIKPNREIVSFFEQNRKLNFVHHERMPCSFWSENGGDGGMWRLQRYSLQLFGRRVEYPARRKPDPDTFKGKAFHMFSDLFCGLRFRVPRRSPRYVIPYGGSAALNLNPAAVRYVLDFVKKHRDYLRFHQYTDVPEEIFFQTILLNAREDLRDSIVNENLNYQKWVRTTHPEILMTSDLPELRSTSSLFARKFDVDVDSEVLDMLDANAREGH